MVVMSYHTCVFPPSTVLPGKSPSSVIINVVVGLSSSSCIVVVFFLENSEKPMQHTQDATAGGAVCTSLAAWLHEHGADFHKLSFKESGMYFISKNPLPFTTLCNTPNATTNTIHININTAHDNNQHHNTTDTTNTNLSTTLVSHHQHYHQHHHQHYHQHYHQHHYNTTTTTQHDASSIR